MSKERASHLTEKEMENIRRGIERKLYSCVVHMENPRCNGLVSEREALQWCIGAIKETLEEAEYLVTFDECAFLDDKRDRKIEP